MEKALEVLKRYYGFDSFREGQNKIVKSILEGRDTFAIMPTGAGKSICFQVPALLFDGVTLVISPLISLMKDQVDGLNTLGINAAFINSSLSQKEVVNRISAVRKNEYKLLYIAPERLESESFTEMVKSLDISLLAIDEAHCVSQWGHDFRPSYRNIARLIKNLPKRPIIAAFTATATDDVKVDVVNLLGLKNHNTYITGFDRENLNFSVVRGRNKRDFVLEYLGRNKGKSGIIYAGTRKEVDNIYDFLKRKGYQAGRYHAGMDEGERTSAQEAFLYDDVKVMVATNAFGMGIDKSNVRYVIHYNMPKNMEAYYQEAGRAGRDGEPAECTLLFGSQDIFLQKFLIEQSISSPERRLNEYKKLQVMTDYCHTPKCIRKFILDYFGEQNAPENCDNCSSCNDDRENVDITTEAQMIFSCVVRMRERYGSSLVAEVLKGSKSKKVFQLGFENLPTYGVMKNYTLKDIKDIINLLVSEEYLYLSEGEFPVVKIKDKAVRVLKDGEKVFQKVHKPEEKAEENNSLFEILRVLRKDIADREKVPPYIVFADSTLREMCEHLPQDRDSMLEIKGMGETKFKTFGHEFLKVIQEYAKENNIGSTKSGKDDTKDTPSHILTYNMFKEGLDVNEIAKQRELKTVTIQDHLVRCGVEGLEVDWDLVIPKEYEELILSKIREIGAQKLKPIKEALPEDVDYLAIKAVLCKYKIASA